MNSPRLFILLTALFPLIAQAESPVRTSLELVTAVRDSPEGATIEVAEGTYELESPLEPKAGVTLRGAGMDKTILVPAVDWTPSTATLPDPEKPGVPGLDSRAYLIRLLDKAAGITISDMTLRGPRVHGAIFGFENSKLHLHQLRIQDMLWAGIRTFGMKSASIHDCEFIDAGGRWERGKPGEKGGLTGGGIYAMWMSDCEIRDNRFTRTNMDKAREFYGIKVREAKRCHVHHNTIRVNFSMEFPFENDEDVEIDHNICEGTISIPKHAGGPVPGSGSTFHIHENWFRNSYSIEFVRNGVEIDHNLFDFDIKLDGGNLISAFGNAPADGPASFHNNLISNPGLGVMWLNEIYNHLTIRHNHIIARTTATPRSEGLFGFNKGCDFKTIIIEDNLIECLGQPRPLLRNEASDGATLRNNTLTNVADTGQYQNPHTGGVIGLEQPLKFSCGVHGEFAVEGWKATPVTK